MATTELGKTNSFIKITQLIDPNYCIIVGTLPLFIKDGGWVFEIIPKMEGPEFAHKTGGVGKIGELLQKKEVSLTNTN